MKQRSLSSICIVLVIALAFVLKILVSDYFFDALLVILACFMAYEFSKLLAKSGRKNYIYIATLMPILLLASHIAGFLFGEKINLIWLILIDVAVMIIVFGLTFLFGLTQIRKIKVAIRSKKITSSPVRVAFDKAFNTFIAFIYPSFLFMFMTIINHLDELSASFTSVANFGGYFSLIAMIFVIIIPMLTDTFAYLVGSIFGGKKLCPKISPAKTVSGAIGGLVCATAVSVLLYFVLCSIPGLDNAITTGGLEAWHIAIFALIGSVVSQLGDLFESYCKRRAEVKDSGRVIPGHGGILDRCDSYIFTAPVLMLCFAVLLLCL